MSEQESTQQESPWKNVHPATWFGWVLVAIGLVWGLASLGQERFAFTAGDLLVAGLLLLVLRRLGTR